MRRYLLVLVGTVLALAGGLAAFTGLSAGEKSAEPTNLQFVRDNKSFYVPSAFSPIRIVRLKFHPTEPYLLAQVSDRRLAIWDLRGEPEKTKGQKELQVLPLMACEQETGWISGFDVHPTGKWLVTAGTDRKIRLWSWSDSKPAARPTLEVAGHDGWIEAAAYSPNGKLLATAGNDRRVRLWDADSLKPIEEFTGHSGPIRDLAWSSQAEQLFSGSEDGKILEYSRAKKQVVQTLPFGNANEQQGQDPAHSGVFRLACSPDGQWLSAAGQGKFGLFNLKSGNLAASENLSFDTAFYPEGLFLVAGFDTSKVFRLDPSKLATVSLDPSGKKGKTTGSPGETIDTLKRNSGYGLTISKDGKLLAAATGESTVSVWKILRK